MRAIDGEKSGKLRVLRNGAHAAKKHTAAFAGTNKDRAAVVAGMSACFCNFPVIFLCPTIVEDFLHQIYIKKCVFGKKL